MSIKINMKVESYDVQPNGNIKISSLLKFLQKAAGDDVMGTGLDYFSLASKNIAFVLTKMNIKIIKDIKLYDELCIISHPRNSHGATFPRDYVVKVNNETVALIKSMWVLLDLEKRTVLRPSAIADMGSLLISDDDDFDLQDVRRIIDAASLSRTNVQRVDYYHLDMNNHLNNTYYSDFIFNCLDRNIYSSDAGLYMQINYKAEARIGDVLDIHYDCDEESGEYDFIACNETGEKICFTAYVKFDCN